jgi:hypothetical protein
LKKRRIQDHQKDPFDAFFDELIDSNCVYQGNEDSIPFFQNTNQSTLPEVPCSESEDSENSMSYCVPGSSFGDSLIKIDYHGRTKSFSGFAISSGWSSTFFPCGDED